jgi:hypothetical protein
MYIQHNVPRELPDTVNFHHLLEQFVGKSTVQAQVTLSSSSSLRLSRDTFAPRAEVCRSCLCNVCMCVCVCVCVCVCLSLCVCESMPICDD